MRTAEGLALFAVVVAAFFLVLWVHHMIKAHGFWVLVARWHLGKSLDGRPRTNATFWQPATKVLHPSGRAHPWHWMREGHRGGIRLAAEIVLVLLVIGLFSEREPTLIVLGFVALLGAAGFVAHTVVKIINFRHHRHYVAPLERTLMARVGAAPETLQIERAGDAVTSVTIEWAPELEIGQADQDNVLMAVTERLGLEAPDAAWNVKGRNRAVTFTHSDPPPASVTWENLRAQVEAAGPADLIMGLGKRRALVSASLTDDSPHIGISIASGGGKSNLTAWLLCQRLRRGAIALVLDSKYFSHPWAFKDIDAEYGQLPNVAYAQRTEELHDAMVWLGEEVERRTEVAERAINSQGKILGDVGPEIIIVCEELNLAADRLRQYWYELRDKEDPKKSPAFAGMGAVAYAGRAVKMRLVVIGQMLTADVLGGGAVRENIGIRLLSRYTKNSWKMQAGDLPMPPSPNRPGHMQMVIGSAVTEVQVPYVEPLVRDLVMTEHMTPCPAGMPGMSRHPLLVPVPGLPALETGPDQPVVPGHPPRPRTYTLREAREEGLLKLSDTAARKRAQRAAKRNYPPGDFPAPVIPARPGVAAEWRGSDLAQWQQHNPR